MSWPAPAGPAKGTNMALFDLFKKQDDSNPSVGTDWREGVVCAPVDGSLVQLSETPDEVIASGRLGQGVGIRPAGDTVFAPVSGTLSALAETHHALGITTDDGCQVIVHIGVNTVEMMGAGFAAYVEQDQRVEAGQALVRFSPEKIAAAGKDDTVFVVVSDHADYATVSPAADAEVKAGQVVIELSK